MQDKQPVGNGIEAGLDDDVVLECQGAGICYRKPYKLGRSHGREAREFWPLRDFNLKLHRGETLGITGRNGAGKSTLLRMLAGVIEPDAGRVLRRSGLNVQLLSINLGFERILSGRENAVMAGMLLGESRAEIESCLEEIKEYSELGDFFEEPVYSYSSGMVSRLGFSIAMQAKPDVLLLDEVLSVGDSSFQEKSKLATRAMIESGKSVVLVSHNKSTHQDLSDRVIEL